MGRHGDKTMNRQMCAVISLVGILVAGMITFSIAILVALPQINETGAAPVEMNNDMKRMKAEGLTWFNEHVRNQFPSDQVTMTATQLVDIIDKGHGIGVKVNTVLNAVPTEVLANGIEAGFGVIEKVNVALSKDGSGDLGADLHRILSQGATWMETVNINEIQSGAKAATGILSEVNRLMKEIPSEHFKDIVYKVHTILDQAATDNIVDHISQLGDGVSKVLARLNSKDGLTIKL